MVEIKKTSVEGFLGSLGGEGDVKVSLFLVSKKNPRLKKLNLNKLSPEEKAAKLKSIGQDNRFVLVIQKGDMVFAHAHGKYAEELQKLDGLSLDEKKVFVKALSDEDAEQVASIGAAFDEHVLDHLEEEEAKKEEKAEKDESQYAHLPVARQQYFAKKALISDEVHSQFLFKQMVEKKLGQLIIDCMERFQEAHEELEKQQEAYDKYFRIKEKEIVRSILGTEIKKGEVKSQEQRHDIMTNDVL